jgi:lysophospholipase L1-like esterase
MWKNNARLQIDCLQSEPDVGDGISCPQILEIVAMNRIFLRFAFAAVTFPGLLTSACLGAQEPGNVPETKAPPPEKTTTEAAKPASSKAEQVAAWKKAHDDQLKTDFPLLAKFKEDDLALPPPAPGENRVVFMGDSITEGWHFDGPQGSFPGKPYINRGISGQTTPQMVLRFRQDVIALKPKVVVILAGTNDIAGNTGPMTLEQTEDNLASMADLATMNHIKVVLCSVTPAFDYPWMPGLTPAPKIVAINTWMKSYAAEKGYVFVDFHSAMKDEKDGLPANLSGDGVHPLPAGYAVMNPLVEAGIAKALTQ